MHADADFFVTTILILGCLRPVAIIVARLTHSCGTVIHRFTRPTGDSSPERSRWPIERRRCWRGRGGSGLPVGARPGRVSLEARGQLLECLGCIYRVVITAVPYAAEVVTRMYAWRVDKMRTVSRNSRGI